MKKIFAITVAAVAFLFIVNALAWSYLNCDFVANKYLCYMSRINRATEARNTAGALAYVQDVVLKTNGYAMVHFLLHAEGEKAYLSDPNITKLSVYLAPYAAVFKGDPFMRGFDGFFARLSCRVHKRSEEISVVCRLDGGCM